MRENETPYSVTGFRVDGAILEASAATYTAREPGGTAAWAWLKPNVYDMADYSQEFLSWALLARASGTAPVSSLRVGVELLGSGGGSPARLFATG